MFLLKWISGSRFYALLAFSASVEDDIARRRLHQLKEKMAQCSEEPKSRYFGVASFFHVLVASTYALFFSAIANVAALRPTFSAIFVIAGFAWLLVLMIPTFLIEKGRRVGLVALLYSWFFHLALSLATLIYGFGFLPLSRISILCWCAGALLVWLAWKVINSREMSILVRWCLRLKMRQTLTRQLQRRSVKKRSKPPAIPQKRR